MTCKNRAKNCGGCPLLEVPYPEQLKQKEAKVRALLGKYGPENVIKVYGEDEGLRLSGMVRAEAEKFAKAEAAKAKKSAAAAA